MSHLYKDGHEVSLEAGSQGGRSPAPMPPHEADHVSYHPICQNLSLHQQQKAVSGSFASHASEQSVTWAWFTAPREPAIALCALD